MAVRVIGDCYFIYMNFQTVQSTKNLVLGDNFNSFFGATTIVVSAPLTYNTLLTKDQTVQTLVGAVTPVTLSDVYNLLPMLTGSSLFFVLNAQSAMQAVLLWKDSNGKWNVVSPTVSQCPSYYQGTKVYSKTPITQTL